MAFCLTFGGHHFRKPLAGYENLTFQCQNCGNHSARAISDWQWFTVCFIPLIPFSLKPWHEVACHICNFNQDIKYRPDVQQALNGGGSGGPPGGGGQQYPMTDQMHGGAGGGPPPPGGQQSAKPNGNYQYA